MNSIKEPRRRPRDRSTSWLTFKWVLVREAYLRLILTGLETEAEVRYWRRKVAARNTDRLQADAERILRAWPSRRFRP